MGMISKDDVKSKLLARLNSSIGYGLDMDFVIEQFIEENKICPSMVSEILHELGEEHTRLDDGRVLIPATETRYCPLSEQYSGELWAHKHLHTGAIKCGKKVIL
jgi:hypothetical protein